MPKGVLIDGSLGEGGGHVLRTALTLSLMTGLPMRLPRLRAGKKSSPKGLGEEHLAVIRMAAAVGQARFAGVELGSQDIYFEPHGVRSGDFVENLEGAGSTTQILQTIALPLCMADGPSRVSLFGATHAHGSSTFELLRSDWLPAMEEMGLPIQVRLRKVGYAPDGGGEILALIPGGGLCKPISRRVRGNLRSIQGRVFFSRVQAKLAERAVREARLHLRRAGVSVRVDPEEKREAGGEGWGVHLEAVLEGETHVGFSVMGGVDRSPDRTARAAVNALFDWTDSGAGVTMFIADQILLPLCFADGPSVFTVSRVTRHLQTTAELARMFLGNRVRIEGAAGEPGEVRIQPGPRSG